MKLGFKWILEAELLEGCSISSAPVPHIQRETLWLHHAVAQWILSYHLWKLVWGPLSSFNTTQSYFVPLRLQPLCRDWPPAQELLGMPRTLAVTHTWGDGTGLILLSEAGWTVQDRIYRYFKPSMFCLDNFLPSGEYAKIVKLTKKNPQVRSQWNKYFSSQLCTYFNRVPLMIKQRSLLEKALALFHMQLSLTYTGGSNHSI